MVRLLQFVVFALPTFIASLYFGAMILLPPDIVVLITKFLHVLGVDALFGAIVAVPVVAYLGIVVYSIPGLIQMIIENGIDLANTGKQKVEAFNKIAESAK
jgi:hypothetical protein